MRGAFPLRRYRAVEAGFKPAPTKGFSFPWVGKNAQVNFNHKKNAAPAKRGGVDFFF
jgi:hypothetical protein